jgi:hypothetical protein
MEGGMSLATASALVQKKKVMILADFDVAVDTAYNDIT